MKVRCKNFRFHTDREFVIPSKGLVALSGKKGTGKSTVLFAISYALFGKIPGRVKKDPYSNNGSKTSTVELEISLDEGKTLSIVRNAKPKSLIVTLEEVEYEGDAAQSIIETELCMNYEEFIAGVYIVQRSDASVLSMTPSEQIQFVETLSKHSGSQGAEVFKEKLKNAIKECKSERLKKQGELEALEVELEHLESDKPEECEVPEEIEAGVIPDEVREEISNYEIELLDVNKKIQEFQQKLNKVRDEEKAFSEVRKKIQKLETEIAMYDKNLEDLGSEPTEKEIENAEVALETEKTNLSIEETKLQIKRELFQLEEAVNSHYEALDEKLETLKKEKNNLEDFETLEKKVEELTELAKDYDVRKTLEETNKRIKEDARKKLADIFRQIKSNSLFSEAKETLSQIKTPNKMIAFLQDFTKLCLTCPKCNSSLIYNESTQKAEITQKFHSQNLEKKTEALKYIKMIEENGRNLALQIEETPQTRPDVEQAVKNLTKARRITEEVENLEKRELSSTLLKMQTRIYKEAEKLGIETNQEALLFYKSEGVEKLKESKESVENAKNNLENLKRTREIANNTKKEIAKRKTALQNLKKTLPDSGVDKKSSSLEKNLVNLTKKSGEIHAEISKRRELLDSFSEYEAYLAYENSLSSIRKRLKVCKKKIQTIDDKLEGYYGLESTGKEAEILSLEETARSINEHARFYLDEMFEDPISVTLSCIKELKSGKTSKLQMNTVITYQGHTYKSVDDLSGGERQMCDIAFLLAVNDMIGSRMILLDECLNNLDESINTDVLCMIRDLCGGNKLILVVSHEAVRGVFDEEIFL